MRAKSFKAATWDAAAIGADEARLGFAGSPTKVVRTFHPEARPGGEMIGGAPAEAAARLAERLRALGVCR
jgi:electron transfer flavoprotein alpha/beta subunit